jgi:phosphoribosylformylglycinamidine (FGAM) synthase-like amidotransferase family enzyme
LTASTVNLEKKVPGLLPHAERAYRADYKLNDEDMEDEEKDEEELEREEEEEESEEDELQ